VTDVEFGPESASLGPLGIAPPPIFVGSAGIETAGIAARFADGWNAVVTDTDRYHQLATQIDRFCEQVGRKRSLRKAVQIFVRDIDLRDAHQIIAELENAGADSVTFVLHEQRGPEAVWRLARAVL
jgi:alkanesulfonate monooxygenase SsuD/methylene tetrahydromethanopterin reductase-like flavin-dependent oxidoreductase (luciferase family)